MEIINVSIDDLKPYAAAQRWSLSERERAIVQSLGGEDYDDF